MIERWITLCCVSNEVGGPLISNARWLGARLADLLREAGIQPDSDQLLMTSVDGMTIGAPTKVVMDGRDALLAVGMNGEPLPIEHGFPARIVVPGLYGYVSACKWVVDIKATTFADARRTGCRAVGRQLETAIRLSRASTRPRRRRRAVAGRRRRRRRLGPARRRLEGRGAGRRRPVAVGAAGGRAVDRHLAAVGARVDPAGGRAPRLRVRATEETAACSRSERRCSPRARRAAHRVGTGRDEHRLPSTVTTRGSRSLPFGRQPRRPRHVRAAVRPDELVRCADRHGLVIAGLLCHRDTSTPRTTTAGTGSGCSRARRRAVGRRRPAVPAPELGPSVSQHRAACCIGWALLLSGVRVGCSSPRAWSSSAGLRPGLVAPSDRSSSAPAAGLRLARLPAARARTSPAASSGSSSP